MNLEEMLEDIQTVGGTLSNIEASSDVTITKVPDIDPIKVPVETSILGPMENKETGIKDSIIKRLARYDELVKSNAKAETTYEEVYQELLASNPELAEKLKLIETEKSACENEMESIKKELLPMFQVAVVEDPNNKTLLCNKVQATYVYPTKKHSFDLKDFMEKESAFYFDNISKFAPYAKISDVSDSIKITIKK